MLGEPKTFWGKLRRDDHGTLQEWHPLIDHCADVAAMVEALLALPVWRRRLVGLAGFDPGEQGWSRLCVLGALHDLGKLNLGFQAKGRAGLGPRAGHVTEALAALFRDDIFPWLRDLATWGDGTCGLLVAAVCHHGRPHGHERGTWQASWWKPRGGLDPKTGGEDLFHRCQEWFPSAFAAGGLSFAESRPLEHAFAGLVMLADWLASDTRFFPYARENDEARMPVARARARQALADAAIAFELAARRDVLGRGPFERLAPPDYDPRPAQQTILALPCDDNGSITVLEAETGSGKTEAALARFVSLFEAGLVDGLYFALPTRSAATQIHRRVHVAVQRAFVAPPPVVLAVPGYLRVDDAEGRRLAPFDVLWPDHDRFRYRAWAGEAPKRYLAGCIIVGTVDQVLLSSLMVGHAHLRAASLLRHLLVVDEVHASDAYMTRILQDVLARHLRAGGHALLLSATLGSEARAQLLCPDRRPQPPPIAEAEATPYPLVSHRGASDQAVGVRVTDVGRVVEVTAEPWIEDATAPAARALESAMQGAKVLVVKNTVNDCIEMQVAIETAASARGAQNLLFSCAGVAAPHHARFARVDREALDAALEERIGKVRPDGGCVVVATQTVQQSLDIDADLLLTDLCPADVLLQRIGRMHRHPRPRPGGFQVPRAVILVPAQRDLGVLLGQGGQARHHHGLGSVYADLRVLEATWRLIEQEPHWRIPAMSRRLVERSLHSSVLAAIVSEGGPRWTAHATYMMGSVRGQARHAQLNLVDWSRSYSEMSFPNSADERIATRLGEGDRRVRLLPSVAGPFGAAVGELVLPARWARGAAPELEAAAAVVSRDGVTRFVFGDRGFVYDRLGLRPESAQPREVMDDDGP